MILDGSVGVKANVRIVYRNSGAYLALVSCVAIAPTDLVVGASTTTRDLGGGGEWGSRMRAHKHTDDRGEQHGSRLPYGWTAFCDC